ncbi:uncharacterized protein N7511_002219 [Penicillium nucicola]|uniref:uncharacterized protein n=1 Tax=Penicillium nucicola TaxID=1850975 RepID=UPI0025451524|nr:uncharacterized protein N7511_002219 [Penicillium nucicola]KAJ5770168.1 hypothetical protein N7511_002219 [Penicillium nucicola]
MPVFRLQLQNSANWALWLAELRSDLLHKNDYYWEILSGGFKRPRDEKSDIYKEWKRMDIYLMETMASRIDRDLLYHLKQTSHACDAFETLCFLHSDLTPHAQNMDNHISSTFYRAWVKLEYCVGQAPQDFVYAFNLLATEVDEWCSIRSPAVFEQFLIAVSAHPSSAYWFENLRRHPCSDRQVTERFLCNFVEFEKQRISNEAKLS